MWSIDTSLGLVYLTKRCLGNRWRFKVYFIKLANTMCISVKPVIAENEERIVPIGLESCDLSAGTIHATDKQPVFHGEDEACPVIYPYVLSSIVCEVAKSVSIRQICIDKALQWTMTPQNLF